MSIIRNAQVTTKTRQVLNLKVQPSAVPQSPGASAGQSGLNKTSDKTIQPDWREHLSKLTAQEQKNLISSVFAQELKSETECARSKGVEQAKTQIADEVKQQNSIATEENERLKIELQNQIAMLKQLVINFEKGAYEVVIDQKKQVVEFTQLAILKLLEEKLTDASYVGNLVPSIADEFAAERPLTLELSEREFGVFQALKLFSDEDIQVVSCNKLSQGDYCLRLPDGVITSTLREKLASVLTLMSVEVNK